MELDAYSEFLRLGPDGTVVASDRGQDSPAPIGRTLALSAPRNGYISFFLFVKDVQRGTYTLSIEFDRASTGIRSEMFKVWYHRLRRKEVSIPDALIPVSNPSTGQIPDPDNRVPNQAGQAFWVDLWIPSELPPGMHRGHALLRSGGRSSRLQLQIRVLSTVIPEEDGLTIDHNSYGTNWLASLYPKQSDAEGKAFYRSDSLFKLIHAYHRLFYEHRGTFHQLGYGHAGKVGPEFAPVLEGEGRNRHVANWELFDRHYGPLLDGTAFRGTRRGTRPVPYVYLPINPEWPASFLNWGEPGYEREFVNVLRDMEHHFREKGWTNTQFEMFFNHKKRYKGFYWDGDEARFAKDDEPLREYGRLLKEAVPSTSPVHFAFRADVSWRIEEQFKALAGVINFWVCSQTILSWLPEQLKPVRERGDIVWTYSGPPSIRASASAILENPLRAWMWNVDGYVHWLTVSPSQDPWFNSEGEQTCLAYPGERFGIDGPIPSIRLKIQRNFAQDVALLKRLERKHPGELLRNQIAQRINGSTFNDWWTPRPAMADLRAEEWTNSGIEGGIEPNLHIFKNWPPQFWAGVRQYVLNLSEGDRKP